jgi:hypothetical protein
MRVFIYRTSEKAPFEGLFERISDKIIFFSNDSKEIKRFNQHSGEHIKDLLPEGISSDPTDETICCIPPNDKCLFFIPSDMKNTFRELLKRQYKKTECAEYKTTTKPEIGLVGNNNLSRFYETFEIQSVISSDKIEIADELPQTEIADEPPQIEIADEPPQIAGEKPDEPPQIEIADEKPQIADEKPPIRVKLYLVLVVVVLIAVLSLIGGLIGGIISQRNFFNGDKKTSDIEEQQTDPISESPNNVGEEITVLDTPLPSIEVKKEPKNLMDWATLLVQELEENIQTPQNVYVNPLTLFMLGEQKEPVDVFDSVLHDALAKSTQLKPLTPLLGSITLFSLRQRAKRETSNEGLSLVADLLNADYELNGKVQINEGQVHVEITLTNNRAKVIANATVAFPKSILAQEIITQTDDAVRPIKPHISQGDLRLEIATSHGVHKVTYQAGEFLRLFIRTNQPAYVYVFVENFKKHVTWLYPEGPNALQKQVNAGELFILPEDRLDYELVVQAPFGFTTIWVVALTNQLELPTETDDTWFQMDTLRSQVREFGLATSDGYAEAEMVVETIGSPDNQNGNWLSPD